MRSEIDKEGRETLQELRLRINSPPELVLSGGILTAKGIVRKEDLHYCVNTACRYSHWSADTSCKGYITAPGGHRIGLCGEMICEKGAAKGIRDLTSLCIRVARDYPGISGHIPLVNRLTLILGAPGWGKTTLLRDLCRRRSQAETVCVLDERGELFPQAIPRGKRMDVMTGCPKATGIEVLLRTMGPSCIAVDEITAEEDCRALIQAANCGVSLLATAHGESKADILQRSIYRPLVEQNMISLLVILRRDKSYFLERMSGCI